MSIYRTVAGNGADVLEAGAMCESGGYVYLAAGTDQEAGGERDLGLVKLNKSDLSQVSAVYFDLTHATFGQIVANDMVSDGNYLYVVGTVYGGNAGLIGKFDLDDLSLVDSLLIPCESGSGQAAGRDIRFYSVCADDDAAGFVYVAGWYHSTDDETNYRPLIVKYNKSDLTIAAVKYLGKGSSGSPDGIFYAIAYDQVNDEVFAGGYFQTLDPPGSWYPNFYIVRFDTDLAIQEQCSYADLSDDRGRSFVYSLKVDGTNVYAAGHWEDTVSPAKEHAILLKAPVGDLTDYTAYYMVDASNDCEFHDLFLDSDNIYLFGDYAASSRQIIVKVAKSDITSTVQQVMLTAPTTIPTCKGAGVDGSFLYMYSLDTPDDCFVARYNIALDQTGNDGGFTLATLSGPSWNSFTLFTAVNPTDYTARTPSPALQENDIPLTPKTETALTTAIGAIATIGTSNPLFSVITDDPTNIGSLAALGNGQIIGAPAVTGLAKITDCSIASARNLAGTGIAEDVDYIYLLTLKAQSGSNWRGGVTKIEKSTWTVSVEKDWNAAGPRNSVFYDIYVDAESSGNVYVCGSAHADNTGKSQAVLLKLDKDLEIVADEYWYVNDSTDALWRRISGEDDYVTVVGQSGGNAPILARYDKSTLTLQTTPNVKQDVLSDWFLGICEDSTYWYVVGGDATYKGHWYKIRKSDYSVTQCLECTTANTLLYGCVEDNTYVYCVGSTNDGASDTAGYFVRINKTDYTTTDWSYEGVGGDDTVFYRVALDSSGNIYILGETNAEGAGTSDFILVKLNSSLALQEAQVIGKVGTNPSLFGFLYSTDDLVYITGQITGTDTPIIRMDPDMDFTGSGDAWVVSDCAAHSEDNPGHVLGSQANSLSNLSGLVDDTDMVEDIEALSLAADDNVGDNDQIVQRGFEWGLTETGTYSASDLGLFASGVYTKGMGEGFVRNTTFYVRAFAKNGSNDTVYGSWVSFVTLNTNVIVTWDGTDVTADIISARYERGKDEELEKATTGTCELRFRNEDAKYNPKNTSSVLYGSLLPGKVLAFNYLYNGVSYSLFKGRIERITPHPKKDDQTCYVYILDGMDYLAKAEFSLPLSENVATNLAVRDILDEAGWPALASGSADATEASKLHDADGGFDSEMVGCDVYNTTDDTWTKVSAFVDSGELTLDDNIFVSGESYIVKSYRIDSVGIQGEMPILPWFQEKALKGIEEVVDCEFGFFYIDNYARAIFESRHHRITNSRSQTSQYSFVEADIIDLVYDFSAARIYTEVRGAFTSWAQDATTVDIAKFENENPKIDPNSSRVFWIEFDDIASTAKIVKGTDVQAHTATAAGGTDVSASLTINVDGSGFINTNDLYAKGARVEFTNGTSDDMYLSIPGDTDNGFNVQGDVFEEVQSVSVKSTDSVAEGNYFKRTHAIDGKYFSSSADLQGMCDYMVGRNKDPMPILVLEIKNKTEALLAAMFDLRISDRITVTCSQLDIDSATDFFINKIEHLIEDAGQFHTMHLTISQCELDSGGAGGEQVWILGAAANCRLGTAYGECVVGWP